MRKVFFHTFWVLAGREAGERSRPFDRAWLTTVMPPYYKGSGVSVRLGERSLRVGLCYPRMPVTVDPDDVEYDAAHMDAMGGRQMTWKEYQRENLQED